MRGGSIATLLTLALSAFATGACSSVSNLLPSSSSSASASATTSATGAAGSGSGAGTATAAATPVPGFAPEDWECPDVTVRSGASTLMVNTPKPAGAETTANDVRYQGTFVRFSRECAPRPGTMNMKVGIQGRVISGPAGGPGTVEVPVRIAVVQEGPEPKTVVSKLARIPVTIGADAGFTDFTHVDQDVSFPLPKNQTDMGNYVVYVGFDPSAAAPKPAAPTRRKR